MNICLCFGPDWLKYVPTELYSLFRHNRVENVYLLSEKLSEADFAEVAAICRDFNVQWHYYDVENFFKRNLKSGKNVDSRFTKYTLYRLAIPHFVPADRLLYLDADTLVVGDIGEFYNAPFDGAVMIGCRDDGLQAGHKKSLRKSEDDLYLNAGVLLMDLKYIREQKLSERWMSLASTRHYPAHDQDIFFLTLHGKFRAVDPIYNASLSTRYDMPDEDVRIVHFAGDKRKNWVYDLPKANLWRDAEAEYGKYRVTALAAPRTADRIKRKIVYGWFGRGPKPSKIQQCIDSWARVAPHWEVEELNEDNCDVTCLPFVHGAYQARKFAFVADYFRLKAMYEQGCVSLDADVELLKPLDDFLHHRMFSGQEINGKVLITATMGAEAGHPLVRMMMQYYEVQEFTPQYNVPNTQWITPLFHQFPHGFDKASGKITLKQDVHLYPQKFFCNFDHRKMRHIPDPASYAQHHFTGSWKTK